MPCMASIQQQQQQQHSNLGSITFDWLDDCKPQYSTVRYVRYLLYRTHPTTKQIQINK